jgi:hypothetical protein
MTCSLATNHAVLSGSMFAWAAGPSRCRTLGCGGISSGPCRCEQVCHPRHPSCRIPKNQKLYASLQLLYLGWPKSKASDPRTQARHASSLGVVKAARPSLTSLAFSHVADLPNRSLNLATLDGPPPAELCRQSQGSADSTFGRTVTSPTRDAFPHRGQA